MRIMSGGLVERYMVPIRPLPGTLLTVTDAQEERETPQQLAADQALASRAGTILNEHYPGHPWAVHTDHEQGVMTVWNMALSDKYKMVMHLGKSRSAAEFRAWVINAGGEFLERYDIPRGAMRSEDYATAKAQF